MNSGPKPAAELHKWVKCATPRDSFQGYVHNDVTHFYKEGQFVTLEADDVQWNDLGCQVYVGAHIYTLWFAHQLVGKKDLFDEN